MSHEKWKQVEWWASLEVAGIKISEGGKGLIIEMTMDGAARLVQSLQGVKSVATEIHLQDYFLEELTNLGKMAR